MGWGLEHLGRLREKEGSEGLLEELALGPDPKEAGLNLGRQRWEKELPRRSHVNHSPGQESNPAVVWDTERGRGMGLWRRDRGGQAKRESQHRTQATL